MKKILSLLEWVLIAIIFIGMWHFILVRDWVGAIASFILLGIWKFPNIYEEEES